jgi:hypothetical protein
VHPRSYEFYYKSVAAHQLAFGQVPIKLFFADATKPREILSTGLERSRVMSLAPVASNIDLDSWGLVSFTTKPFKQWWSEYHQHLFCEPTMVYC